MESVRYISIDSILEQVKRRNPWIDRINFYDICSYIDESYGLIASPVSFINRVTGNSLIRPHVKVKNYVGELPPDLIDVEVGGVRDVDSGIVYRQSLDSFHKMPHQTGNNLYVTGSKTYKIENGYIYLGEDEEATLEISYKAMPIDDRGFPMIVDRPKFKKAIESTILYYEGWKMYSIDLLSEKVWRTIEQDYLWWIGAAGTEGSMPHGDKLESWKNMSNRLYPKVNFHASSFKFAGIQEDIKTGR